MLESLISLIERLVVAIEQIASQGKGSGTATTAATATEAPAEEAPKRRRRRTKVQKAPLPEEDEEDEDEDEEDEEGDDLLGDDVEEIDQKALIGKAREVMKKGIAQKKAVATILKKFKVKKITELDESDYADVYAAMDDID